MMYEGLQMDIFIKELKILLSSIVFKRNVLASAGDTLEITKEAEMYLMAVEGMDDFSSYVNFDRDVYKMAGIPDALISEYLGDKTKIPYGLRDAIVALERKYIIANYVEKNNYYRMLNGLPDLDDTDFVYVPKNDYDISTNIPIHQLDPTNMARLMNSGILPTIIAANPTKKYLSHLGDYSVSIFKSREAMNYEMLYCSNTDPSNIGLDFKKYYTNAREYYMNAIYNPNLAKTYKFYDNFIGFCIIIMAVQRLFASIYKQGITRDFYDTQLIRYLFESYNIPYIEEMTLDQMKIMAKNLNVFLAMKSSTRVLFDICSIFGFNNVNIYKYLLVRDHVKDAVTGAPYFATKTIANGDGTFSTQPDYAKMYDIYFQKVNVQSQDMSTALDDKSNKVDYSAMVTNDIYWVDDDALREKLYTAKFNRIESKYISLDIMFRITAMMYEICHTFRMIMDNHSQFSKVSISVPKISSKQQDLFTLVIFLCAMFCKRFKFKGEIPLKPASIAYVYGFNFNADLTKIINDVQQSKYIDSTVIQYMLNFSVNSSKDVDRIYSNIKTLKDFIVEQMATTKNYEVYRAYRALYNSVLVVQDREAIYAKADGTFAQTYDEMLAELSPELHTYLEAFDTTDENYTVEIMEHILYRLEDLSSQYKYLHTAVESNALFSVLIKLIKLFKSYTVDLSSAGILYLFDDRYFNLMKILDCLAEVDVKMDVKSKIHGLYMDMISTMEVTIPGNANIDIEDSVEFFIKRYLLEYIHLKDDVSLVSIDKTVRSKLINSYADDFSMIVDISHDDSVKLLDSMTDSIIRAFGNDIIRLKDSMSRILSSIDKETRLLLRDYLGKQVTANVKSSLSAKDQIANVSVYKFSEDGFVPKLVCDIIDTIHIDKKLDMIDFSYPEVSIDAKSKMGLSDSLKILSVIE